MLYGPLLLSVVAATFPATGPRVTCHDSVLPDDWIIREGGTPGGAAAALVYQNVGGVPSYFSEGAMADKSNARLQIKVWAARPGDRHAIVRKLMKALAAHPQFEPLTTPVDDYNTTLRLYGAQFDVSCWFDDI